MGLLLMQVSGYSLGYFHNESGIRIIFGIQTLWKKPVLGESFSIQPFLFSFPLLLIQFCKYRCTFIPFLILHMSLLKTFLLKEFSIVDLLECYWIIRSCAGVSQVSLLVALPLNQESRGPSEKVLLPHSSPAFTENLLLMTREGQTWCLWRSISSSLLCGVGRTVQGWERSGHTTTSYNRFIGREMPGCLWPGVGRAAASQPSRGHWLLQFFHGADTGPRLLPLSQKCGWKRGPHTTRDKLRGGLHGRPYKLRDRK